MKLPLIAVALVAALILDPGEAFGVPSPVAIVLPATGDGSVAIVCGIVNNILPRSVRCSTILATAGAGEAFDISPNVTFVSISSGRDTMCGLQSDGTNFFCWKHTFRNGNGSATMSHTLQKVYQDHFVALQDLAVDEDQVTTATNRNHTFIGWWRRRNDSSFHSRIPGRYRSLTSGKGFFCAIDGEDKVVCWGPKAQNIYRAFKGEKMSTIVSGESHACGATKDGRLICGGNNDYGQCNPPKSSIRFEFMSLALGATHTCAARTQMQDFTVVCWGAGVGVYSPTNDTAISYVVAAGNLTCGVDVGCRNMLCWWTSQESPAKVVQVPLGREVLDGICVPWDSCPCGYNVLSEVYCADSNVICDPCYSN